MIWWYNGPLADRSEDCLFLWKLIIYLMRKILKPAWLEKYTGIYRQSGWKGIAKSGGIKLIIAFFLFYLIRDSILYILPIYLGLQGIQSCYN